MTFEIYLLIKLFPFYQKIKICSLFLMMERCSFYASNHYIMLVSSPFLFISSLISFQSYFCVLLISVFFCLFLKEMEKYTFLCCRYKCLYFYDISFNWIPNSPFGKNTREIWCWVRKWVWWTTKKIKKLKKVFEMTILAWWCLKK